MNKKTKLGLGAGVLLFAAVALSGCTASFCSTLDKAHMLYAFDYGVSSYEASNTETTEIVSSDGTTTYTINATISADIANCVSLEGIIEDAEDAGLIAPSLSYWEQFDLVVLRNVLDAAYAEGIDVTDSSKLIAGPIDDSGTEGVKTTIVYDANGDGVINYDDTNADGNLYSYGALEYDKDGNIAHDFDLFKQYGYLKFYYTTDLNYYNIAIRWENWDAINEELRANPNLSVDDLANNDFVTYYKTQMKSLVSSYRACLTMADGTYGYYGAYGERYPINLENKTYAYAWNRGLLEGLIIWPIGALTDVITRGLLNAGAASGWAQILAILIITLIVRSLMMIFTLGQQSSNAKMQSLQPEIAKLQAKYPNSNTSQVEKARLGQETMKLYKKHNVHPFRSIIVLVIQFPVFICVWGALSGSSLLATGSFLGLNLSSSVSAVLFNASYWTSFSAGGPAALIVFLIMAITQVLSMLLPQIIQKKKAKKIAKLGKNPAQTQQNKMMKIFTIVMMVMIIVMGFSLASGMAIYWIFSAIFSIAQTLIVQAVTEHKGKGKKK